MTITWKLTIAMIFSCYTFSEMIQNPYHLVYFRVNGAEYSVIYNSNDKLEISFRSTYDPSNKGAKLPLSIDIRYFYPSILFYLSRLIFLNLD
jgi:hypothetical protein